MPVINFQDLFNQLKDSIISFAKLSFRQLTDEAITDGKQLLEDTKDKLQHWTELLEQGAITPEDFEMLLLNEKDLIQMHALRQAGLTAIKAEQFRDSILNIITDTIFHVVGL